MALQTAALVTTMLLAAGADQAIAQETTGNGAAPAAQFEPYARFQAHVAGIGDEAEVQDNPSWVGVRFSTGDHVKFLAHGEWSINLIESDTLLAPGGATGGDFLTAERDEIPVLGNRLGYVGVDFGGGGQLLLGKQRAVHYDIANYTTDRLTAFGGGVATLAFPAGTDGGQTGTGRADQTLAYRNTFGILQVAGQLQFQNTTNDSFLDGYGGSVRVTVLPGLELGVSGTTVIVDDEAFARILGLDGNPRYVAVGATYRSDVVEIGAVYAAQKDGDLTGFALPDMVGDEPEVALVGFDAKGVELYGQVNVGPVSIVGAWANYDPDVDVKPLIDPEFRVRYSVVGAWFHTTPHTYAYAEFKVEDSIDAGGEPIDSAFAVGFRYNFSRPFTYRP